jgi:hypothetical protein
MNATVGMSTDPPQINQYAKKGYITVKTKSRFGRRRNSTGAKATNSKIVAKLGRQYSVEGYLKP